MDAKETQAMCFIKKSNIVHDSFYDYSNILYINNKTKIIISCPVHGDFYQSPNAHLSGRGCPACGNIKRVRSNSLTLSDFIEKSNKIHNGVYDYSNSIYKNNHSKIEIICPIHGRFYQMPLNHLRGSGCPICKRSKGESLIRNILLEKSIKFIEQKRFPECKYIRTLPFDFYIPSKNILIEYDGEQHFTGKWNGKVLTKIKNYDKIKTDFVNKENMKLFRISYIDDIRNKIDSLLKS